MKRKHIGVLFELDAKTKTLPIMLDRLGEIRGQLNKVAGVMKGITKERMLSNPEYWQATLVGWSNKLQSLGHECVIIQTEIARHMK